MTNIWIPVVLSRDISNLETGCGDFKQGQRGAVSWTSVGDGGDWFFHPDGTRDDFGFYLDQQAFVAIPLMNDEKPYLRADTLPYSIIYRDLVTNGANSLSNEGIWAVNLLVRYAEELEKQIEELQKEPKDG